MPEYDPYLTPRGLDEFTTGYINCAEWLIDDEERELANMFAEEAITKMVKDCDDFQDAMEDDLRRYCHSYGLTMANAGNDFWLTRNGHGAGFQDRGDQTFLRRLFNFAAHAYGPCEVYAGDDFKFHLS